jgi:hypothetical protein
MTAVTALGTPLSCTSVWTIDSDKSGAGLGMTRNLMNSAIPAAM